MFVCQDCYFINWFDIGYCLSGQGVFVFVIGGDFFFLFVDDLVFVVWVVDYLVYCFFEGGIGDDGVVFLGGQQCCFVDDVGQVGFGYVDGLFGQFVEVGVCGYWFVFGVYVQYCLLICQIGVGYWDLVVEVVWL